MKIKEETGRLIAVDEQEKMIGEAVYHFTEPQIICLDHTYVVPAMRGQKIAGKLMNAIADKARREGWTIIPVCSYARAYFSQSAEPVPIDLSEMSRI